MNIDSFYCSTTITYIDSLYNYNITQSYIVMNNLKYVNYKKYRLTINNNTVNSM